jgi:predicted RNase H-like HicB family nuclease
MSITVYTYSVIWSAEDSEHVGLCAEFPSLSWLAKTPEEALAGIRQVVAECAADMERPT